MKSMKASVLRCALAFVCGVASYSCSVTRHLPPDSYMLTKNKIETDRTVPRDERITAGEIDRYVRQNPSKKLLGTNLPAWLYNQADPNKENGWNNLLRRLGSEPVILDTVQTAASNRNIKLYMDSRGFYESTSRYEIEYKRNRKAVVTYSVRQGAPYRINSLSYDYQDKFLEQVIRQDSAATLIRPGDIFDLTLLNDERQRITAYLKDRGYYKFSVNNISYIADTLAGDHLVDLTMVIRQQLEGYTPEGEPYMGTTPSTASAKSSSIRITTPPRLPPTPPTCAAWTRPTTGGSTSSGRQAQNQAADTAPGHPHLLRLPLQRRRQAAHIE